MSAVPAWPPTATRRILHRHLTAAIADGGICGAVLAVGRGAAPQCRWTAAVGYDQPDPPALPMWPETVFDLASLTKVIATLPLILTLAASRRLRLDDPVVRFLPSFRGNGRNGITLTHLLAHTSGLPASRRYYREFPDTAAVRAAILAERPATEPGTATTYSDIGFMLLGFVAEAVCGTGLPEAARTLVFEPLGMTATCFNPVPHGRMFAPTESFGGAAALRGVVHDRNAQALGGAAGHAGLFAPAADVIAFIGTWTGTTAPPWGRGLTGMALRRHTPSAGPARGLGWVLADHARPGFPPSCWPGSGGHTGFTGTSLAFHPASQAWAVLLTNAIRCGRDPTRLTALRQAVHCTVAEADSARPSLAVPRGSSAVAACWPGGQPR
jgi:CubicO group peptidase (beta-lactamase class C family)